EPIGLAASRRGACGGCSGRRGAVGAERGTLCAGADAEGRGRVPFGCADAGSGFGFLRVVLVGHGDAGIGGPRRIYGGESVAGRAGSAPPPRGCARGGPGGGVWGWPRRGGGGGWGGGWRRGGGPAWRGGVGGGGPGRRAWRCWGGGGGEGRGGPCGCRSGGVC